MSLFFLYCGLILTLILTIPYLLYYRFISAYAQESNLRASDTKLLPHVSLVICTLNSQRTIEAKIRDLLNQNYPLDSLDVTAVDGGSTDRTVEMLGALKRELSGKLGISIISGLKLSTKASQTNEGLRAAQGEVVVTTDADVLLHQDSIRALVESLSAPGIGAVCSRQIPIGSNRNFVTRTEASYRGLYDVLRLGESNLHSTPIFNGGLSGYRKEALSKADEDVNADDTRLALGAIRKGFRAIYSASSMFYVDVAGSFGYAWRQRVRRGQGIQRHFWRNRDLLSRRFGKFAFPIFAANFYMHLISPILFAVALSSFLTFLAISTLSLPIIVIPGLLVMLLAAFLGRQTRFGMTFISFSFYQAALLWAILLHLLGRDFVRWSNPAPIETLNG